MPLRYVKTDPSYRAQLEHQPDEEATVSVRYGSDGSNKLVWAFAYGMAALFCALLIWNLKTTYELTGLVRDLTNDSHNDRGTICAIAIKLDIVAGQCRDRS